MVFKTVTMKLLSNVKVKLKKKQSPQQCLSNLKRFTDLKILTTKTKTNN